MTIASWGGVGGNRPRRDPKLGVVQNTFYALERTRDGLPSGNMERQNVSFLRS